MQKNWKKYLGYGLLLALLVMQFVRIDKTNPTAPPAQDFITSQKPPVSIGNHLKNACYDCHSNNTEYPWYTNVAPISFLIKSHINGGRKHLNFSEWTVYSNKKKTHKIEEIIEAIEEGYMPMKSYTWMHPQAKLSKEDKQEIINYFKSL